MNSTENFKFPDPHQYTTVLNGETKQVYYFKVPEGYVGFIEWIGTLYFANSTVVWKVDNENVETNELARGINSPNMPLRFSPNIIARYSIEFIFTNNTGSNVLMEVLCDGTCVRIPRPKRNMI